MNSIIKKKISFTLIKHKLKIKGGVYFCLGLFTFLSLATYSSLDPSFNRATTIPAANWFGKAGSYSADLFMQFGGLSYIFVSVCFFTLAYRYVFKKPPLNVAINFVGLFFAVVSLSMLFSLLPQASTWPLYVGFGGIAGDIQNKFLVPKITVYGFAALASILFVISSYFSLSLRASELIFIGKKIVEFSIILKDLAVRLGVTLVNIIRVIQNKEPLFVERKKEDFVQKTVEQIKEDIVEYKEPKVVKPRPVKQTALKLIPDEFEFPDVDLLAQAKQNVKNVVNQKSLEQNAKLLKKVLEDFGVQGEIIKVRPGPVVTLYELEPSPGTKSSRVIGLADDIARSMSSVSARISVVPGRNVLGIELPNSERETVYLRELIETEEYRDDRIKLPIALGKEIGGESVMVDLAKMPHLLVAGTTGSGKSVAVNAMILSFLYRLSPEECKFIMIDPKMLELSVYEGIPHLLAPVVTEPKKAVVALKWAVREMENRYRAMSNLGVRNITGYNKRIEEAVKKGEKLERTVQTGFDPQTGEPIFEKQPLEMTSLPFIVIIVDEMADLMLTAGKEIEGSIQRLAQMARAAGIHLVMATQRPSVDVITGVIKANFPTRISFQVTSRIDSRTILGEMGAEQLLGMGDMLYMAGGGRVTRVHGPFVDDKEVDKVVSHLKLQGTPSYIEDVTKDDEESFDEDAMGGGGSGDDLYDRAVAIVTRDKKASTSYVQRQLKIGYNRAADLIDKMEREGVVSAPNHTGRREVVAN